MAIVDAGSSGNGLLAASDVSLYQERGYVVVESLLDEERLRRAREALADFIEGARGLTESNDVYDLESAHRPDAPQVRRMKHPDRLYPIFAEIVRIPKVIGILQQLIGESIRFHISKLNLKAPYIGAPIEWHQDWAFFPHTNDDLIAVGVMLEDCYEENGPLLVIPGSHRGPIYDHHADGIFCGAIDPAKIESVTGTAVPLTGPAGSMSFHHVRLIHGSAQNRSPFPRPLLLYQYKAGDCWPLDGVRDLAAYNADLITGDPTFEPRMEELPVRISLPRPASDGSIYERQSLAKSRYFDTKTSS